MRSVVQLYPGPPLYRGAVAQLGERLVCNQEATGSIPVSSTRIQSSVERCVVQTEKEDEDMRSIADLGIWLIPIVAIVVWGATEIVKTIMHRQERAQMIARGMDPDAPHRKPEAK